VPKWGEPEFVAIDGARFGGDGFVPCGRPGHARSRANLQHTADECRFGGSYRPAATNQQTRRRPGHMASHSGRGRQNNPSGSGYGRQNNFPRHGHHQIPAMAAGNGSSWQDLVLGVVGAGGGPSESLQQHALTLSAMVSLGQQQQQQQPPSGPCRQTPSTDAQSNGIKKNQKRGARKQWPPRKDHNNGPGGSAGAGGAATA
jgi:hypothetical protein